MSEKDELETGIVDARRLLTDEEREAMLARIHSLVYWVGMLIPEHELLEGSEIDLRETVFNLTSKENLTDEEVGEIHELIRLLTEKEKSLERHLSKDPMTVGTAKDILAEVCGILRAIDELRSVESPERAEFKKVEVMKKIEDAKRWQHFLESVKPGAEIQR